MTDLLGTLSGLVLAAEEGGVPELVDGGALASGAWLIMVVPLVATALIILVGKRLPLKGFELAWGSMAFVAVYGTILFIANMGDGISSDHAVQIAQLGSLDIEWGWTVDGLSILMFFVVGVVGLLVFTYAYGYMQDDVRWTFFFASFTLFAGAMLVLVASQNMLQLIVGWEGVGVASYLLIGHYWEKKENSDAAIKAFMTNKIADVGLFLGVIILTITVGSFRFSDVLDAATHDEISSTVAVAAGILIFIGAMGKSGQAPFHVWLPDAMAGPTPVSSLMHAATMVTAGIYLVARMFPFYESVAHDVRPIILAVGTITLFGTGLIALVQNDIKKVLAYSTLSQLGYMMAAMGAGAYIAGLFHLFTHAFFKALLFLGAGSVIHAVHSNDMTDMGGLRKYMPTTYWTWVAASLALVGIFPLAGFFSKDEILASLSDEGYILALLIALGGAVVTAFYMARATFLTFHGTYKGEGHPHESPRVMTWPLIGLGVGTVAFGWLNVPGLFDGFGDWVRNRPFDAEFFGHHASEFNFGLAAIGLALGLAGIAAGYYFFFEDRDTQEARDFFTVPGLYPLLRHKYYLDDIYHHGLVVPIRDRLAAAVNWVNGAVIDGVVNGVAYLMRLFAGVVYGGFDQRGIDLGVNAIAGATGSTGGALRYAQTGKIQQYAAALFAGAVLLVVGFIIFG